MLVGWCLGPGNVHYHKEEIPGTYWTCPYKGRGSLACNQASRLHDYLMGSGGGGCKAMCAETCRPRAGREESYACQSQMRFSGFGHVSEQLSQSQGFPALQ